MKDTLQAIIDLYTQAEFKLIDIIAKSEAKGNTTIYRRRILKQIQAELKALQKESSAWVEAYVPKTYREAADEVEKYFNKLGPVKQTAINRNTIKVIVENTQGLLLESINHVGRIIDDDLRKAAIQATAEKALAGDTVKQMKQNLVEKLTDNGIAAVRYKNGSTMRLDNYAGMVARSTTAETTNRATIQHTKDLGHDLVQMSDHRSACPLCAKYEGRVYSISGNNKDYPALSDVFAYSDGTYANIHPNCRHRLTPYLAKFDDNAEETKKQSNRSFDVDKRSEAEIKQYYTQQKEKAQRNADRKQYEAYRVALPKEAPRTFAAFRMMKKSNSEKYKKMQAAFRSQQ